MSDQAENDATQRILQSFKAAREAKIRLGAQMKALGDSLNALAKTLQNPDRYVFYVDESDSISVGHPPTEPRQHSVARVTPAQFDWKDLCEMLSSYTKAKEDKESSGTQLKGLGIPISED